MQHCVVLFCSICKTDATVPVCAETGGKVNSAVCACPASASTYVTTTAGHVCLGYLVSAAKCVSRSSASDAKCTGVTFANLGLKFNATECGKQLDANGTPCVFVAKTEVTMVTKAQYRARM